MKVAQRKENDNEVIAEYLKRANELARKMSTNEIEIVKATQPLAVPFECMFST